MNVLKIKNERWKDFETNAESLGFEFDAKTEGYVYGTALTLNVDVTNKIIRCSYKTKDLLSELLEITNVPVVLYNLIEDGYVESVSFSTAVSRSEYGDETPRLIKQGLTAKQARHYQEKIRAKKAKVCLPQVVELYLKQVEKYMHNGFITHVDGKNIIDVYADDIVFPSNIQKDLDYLDEKDFYAQVFKEIKKQLTELGYGVEWNFYNGNPHLRVTF